MRASSSCRGLLLFGLLTPCVVGCAHQGDVPSATPGTKDDGSTSRILRDNAALRRRVQILEDRVFRLERGPGDESTARAVASRHQTATAPTAVKRLPDGRELPMYKLEPEYGEGADVAAHRAPEVEPPQSAEQPLEPRRGSESIGFMTAPEEYEDDERWRDSSGFAREEPAPPESGHSYRLEGNRLVEMTQPDKPKPADRPGRGRQGRTVASAYQAALELYRAGAYEEADAAFSAFLSDNPRSDFADNALYWKGETAYDQGRYSDALASFTGVIERFAGGNKAPDALLKVGLCYDKLGDAANASDVLSGLVRAYPGARASDIARARLAELETP